MVGIGYGSRSTNTLLRVLLKFATTRIFQFFLRTAKTGLLNPLGSLQGSITPSLAMRAISASTSPSSAWAIGCCFLAPGMAVGWYVYGLDESAPSIVVGAENVRIADE